jgi:hypothetical protein
MQTHSIESTRAGSGHARWLGRFVGTLAVAFLISDGAGKLLEVKPVIDGTVRLGYGPEVVFGLGVTLLLCTLFYVIPQTSVVGAVLLTGYLGGAIATHVRVGSPLFTHVLFPVYVAAFLWSSLLLRNPRLRLFLSPEMRGARHE